MTLEDLLALLPDNTAGEISAADMRTVVSDLWNRVDQVGTTAARPTTPATGFPYFDTTLGRPIWWDGAAWVDATGAAV